MDRKSHKFSIDQTVCTDNDTHKGNVEIVGLIEGHCGCHQAPMYACTSGDQHFSFCEEYLAPLTRTQRSKLN